MKTFYLARHAGFKNPFNILYGLLPYDLTDEGREHARRMADFFKDTKVKKIFSSPVARCKQTSEIIQEQIGVPMETDKRLMEVFSAVQGMKLDKVNKLKNSMYEFVSELGGEDPTDVQIRMLDFFHEKMETEKKDIIICSHGDPLLMLSAGLEHIELGSPGEFGDTPEYQPKGSVRPVVIDGTSYAFEDIIAV